MSRASIIREPDDSLAEVRISLGKPPGVDDFYLVFRGDPIKVVNLLATALEVAMEELPKGNYQDKRGRPQG